MTPTTNERDRFEAWAKDTMSLVKEPGGYKEATTHHAWRAWQAALTRERRECTCPSGNGSLRWPCPQHPQPETPSEQRKGGLDFQTAVAALVGADEEDQADILAHVRAWVAAAKSPQPQPEAPGAVASTIDAGGFISDTAALAFLRVIGGGNPNVEYAVERLRLSLITPPAPVDVRKVKAMLDDHEAGKLRPEGFVQGIRTLYELALLDGQPTVAPVDVRALRELADKWERWVVHNTTDEGEAFRHCASDLRTLLDGQQAGVDDAMVERAINACCTSGAYFAPETDDEWRAVLQAALGGGGGRG